MVEGEITLLIVSYMIIDPILVKRHRGLGFRTIAF